MSGPSVAQFATRRYLNLETFRRSGEPVRTPVWFAESDGVLYAYSLAGAGKVKRIRNNPRVRVVPCDFWGKPRGEWVSGVARVVDQTEAQRGHQLLNRKYFWKRLGDLFSKLRRRQHIVFAIRLD